MYTTFYIVRHGQTDWNIQKKLQGQANTSLNNVGREQAKEIAQTLKHISFDEIISSDLDRAVQTTEIIAQERKLAVKTTKALREKSYGNYEGRDRKDVQEELKHLFEKVEKLNDEERMNFKIYENGESDHEAVERFIRHLREIAIAYPKKTILIASHGGVMRYFLVKLGWATYAELDNNAIKNAAYIKVESDGIDFFIKETHQIEKAKV
jgi:broad specificity phosphatase PhoE